MTPIYVLFAIAAVVGAADENITAPGCGQTFERKPVSSYIVGGVEARPHSWPFICSLQYSDFHICGGSLVKSRAGVYYFVTAAHCVSASPSRYSIWCSIHDRFGANPNGQKIRVARFTNHENYKSNTFENDISIMELVNQPTENRYLQPVCIANKNYYGGETSYVIGWGTTSEGGYSARKLREVSKPIVSDSDCESAYGAEFYPSSMVCSGLLGVGGKDACQGDSGGPMVSYRNGAYELVGVVSWGYGCARPQYPGVYADVYRLRDWISSKINRIQ